MTELAKHPVNKPNEGFEPTDGDLRIVMIGLSSIAATLLIVLAIVFGVQIWLQKTTPLGSPASVFAPARVIPPEPRLEVHPRETFPQLRAREEERLNNYGKNADGSRRIPIAQAMRLVLPHLKIREGAPKGLIEPPGAGRQYAGSLSSLPQNETAYDNPGGTSNEASHH